jgi:hypothetical protein
VTFVIAAESRLTRAHATVDGIEIRFTGKQLNQEDLESPSQHLESQNPKYGNPLFDSAFLESCSSVGAAGGANRGRDRTRVLLLAAARAVSSLVEDELHAALARLVASELVFQRGMPPDVVYAFKHALVQGAWQSDAQRPAAFARADRRCARNPFTELMDTRPELFAQHYAEPGVPAKAVAYWFKAGVSRTTDRWRCNVKRHQRLHELKEKVTVAFSGPPELNPWRRSKAFWPSAT